MTNFDRPAAWRPALVLLAISIAMGGMAASATAQAGKETPTGKQASTAPAAASKESEKDVPAAGATAVPAGRAPGGAAPATGLRVVKDPATGKLRGPDRAEAARMTPSEEGSVAVPRIVDLPNGNKLVLLDGQFMSETVARRAPDGGITLECHPGAGAGHSHPPAGAGPTSQPKVVKPPVDAAIEPNEGGERNAK